MADFYEMERELEALWGEKSHTRLLRVIASEKANRPRDTLPSWRD
jgi:hypothetical protein